MAWSSRFHSQAALSVRSLCFPEPSSHPFWSPLQPLTHKRRPARQRQCKPLPAEQRLVTRVSSVGGRQETKWILCLSVTGVKWKEAWNSSGASETYRHSLNLWKHLSLKPYLSIYLSSISPSIYPPIYYLSTHLCLSHYLSTHPPIIYLPISLLSLSIPLFIYPSLSLSIHLSCLSIHHIYIFIHPSIYHLCV